MGTIRAFDKADAYLERYANVKIHLDNPLLWSGKNKKDTDGNFRMFDKIDEHARAFWHIWLFNRWLALRLEIMGACFAILVAAVIVYSDIEVSLAGFALSFALQYSE